jgi:hypothetical protein
VQEQERVEQAQERVAQGQAEAGDLSWGARLHLKTAPDAASIGSKAVHANATQAEQGVAHL